MNLSSNDDDDDNINLNNISKLLPKEKKFCSIKNLYRPLQNDVRKTREIFDGRQWHVIEQTIDHDQTTIKDNSFHLMTTKNSNEKDLLELFRFIKNYQTIIDELNV